ncbi:N-acetylglutamate synthase-like GNAT family acetyltransferase [Kineococcus xinjiangensis]|uniref:N-acetylglutamate synthase-like GNAT family acetyltransferase n=1 Tax=Kineococcus xinjiangensis TaxID=512762 RepID=A0A2S6IVE7_9ACTN|nr:GNAT family N-acetyltransferase [Kineococcus xinjiangensis]PPK98334.1 N-acetylglutamate synthase-like GNAT family acetyltransferase [Kineococcus xinjiangensis]
MDGPDPQHRLTTAGQDADLDGRLSAELDAFNVAASGVADQREFTVKIEGDSGELLGGLSGWTWGPSAGISMVWVREDQRGSGLGGRLLAAADDVARERGCRRVFVSSFTFQAPGFYERHGFVECARTPEHPLDGTADVHLVKHLPPTS